MMNVVAALPPSNGKAAGEVGHKHADQGVRDEIVGDAEMTSVMGYEHNLMLF